jgi:hypothetical protein
MSLASQAPLTFIPQAKNKAADASTVSGNTDKPKQLVSSFLSFRSHSSEGTRGSTESSVNSVNTSLNVRCLDESVREAGTVSRCETIITGPYPIPSVTGTLESRHNESNLLSKTTNKSVVCASQQLLVHAACKPSTPRLHPLAKSETADASAVGGDTDELKQFV